MKPFFLWASVPSFFPGQESHSLAGTTTMGLSVFFPLILGAIALAQVNRTIDDTDGDAVSKLVPVYEPASGWAGASCTGCAIQPSASSAYDGTWSAITYSEGIGPANITFYFEGEFIPSPLARLVTLVFFARHGPLCLLYSCQRRRRWNHDEHRMQLHSRWHLGWLLQPHTDYQYRFGIQRLGVLRDWTRTEEPQHVHRRLRHLI